MTDEKPNDKPKSPRSRAKRRNFAAELANLQLWLEARIDALEGLMPLVSTEAASKLSTTNDAYQAVLDKIAGPR